MRLFFTLLFGISFLNINAQQHVCGTSIEDQLLREEISRIAGPSAFQQNRMDRIFIPVTFTLVSQSNGEGIIRKPRVLEQLCKLNADYAQWDMVFYPSDGFDFPEFRSSVAFNDPRNNENLLNSRKDPNALNVFIVGSIGGSGVGTGVVLGYYSPSSDFIVIQIPEVNGESNTLSHEMGHLFSLRHTFFGWECASGDLDYPGYDETLHGNPLEIAVTPCDASLEIETMDGSNCSRSGDMICDTPPDYNFALGPYSTGCGLNRSISDINFEVIKPLFNNQMSYFTTCSNYEFTEGQYNRMLADYNSADRDYMKTNYEANRTPITSLPKMITPANGEKVENFDGVYLEWEPAENADYYLLEIIGSDSGISSYIANDNSKYIVDLKENLTYFVTIFPYNDGYFCAEKSARTSFSTGSGSTSVKDQELFKKLTIAPNPAKEHAFVNIESSSFQSVNVELIDISGKVILSKKQNINAGDNSIKIDLTTCASGIHFINIKTSNGSHTQKLSVVK